MVSIDTALEKRNWKGNANANFHMQQLKEADFIGSGVRWFRRKAGMRIVLRMTTVKRSRFVLQPIKQSIRNVESLKKRRDRSGFKLQLQLLCHVMSIPETLFTTTI